MRYTSFFADSRHKKITSFKDMKGRRYWQSHTMAFFLNGEVIGSGELYPYQGHSLSTDSVGLDDKFRKKGHGIPLYKALIRTAHSIGAKRIYSSRNLNKFSKRMWSEKLSTIFDVKTTKTKCNKCGTCGARKRYYIDLRNL